MRARAEVLQLVEAAGNEEFFGSMLGDDARGMRTHAAIRARPVHDQELPARLQDAAHAAGDGPRWRAEARIPEHLRETAVRGYPDEFYEGVARAYRSLSALSGRPVAELAAANDVPLTTAQRWVKEARARSLLPPGRRGKSG